MSVPIFIIVNNHYELLEKTVESFQTRIKTSFTIIFHDVASTYEPTLTYLKQKENNGYIVYRTQINNHHTVMDSVKDYMRKHVHIEYYVITNPDIMLNSVNGDILEFYKYILNNYDVYSVGPMLEIDDIPDYYCEKQNIIDTHSNQFWNKPRHIVHFKGKTYQMIRCVANDTTFQMHSVKNILTTLPHKKSMRCLYPYSAKCLSWYIDSKIITCKPTQKHIKCNE